jgi:hypothetical protein
LRDKGINVSQAGQQITTLWINQAWPVMFASAGHNAYWILVGINALGFVAVFFLWPETKGISLEHMDHIFGEVDKVEAQVAARGLSTVENILETESVKGVILHNEDTERK